MRLTEDQTRDFFNEGLWSEDQMSRMVDAFNIWQDQMPDAEQWEIDLALTLIAIGESDD